MTYGYLRVSTKEQNEARQVDDMLKRGIKPQHLFLDKCSGGDFQRPAYQRLLKRLRPGDRLVIKSIDRLGRNYREILQEWQRIVNGLGADIQVVDMPLLDTAQNRDLLGTLISDIVLQLLSFIAENERNSIRQRQAEGIAAAKLRGVHLGRPARTLPDNFEEVRARWKAGLLSLSKAAQLTGIPKSTFYYRTKNL